MWIMDRLSGSWTKILPNATGFRIRIIVSRYYYDLIQVSRLIVLPDLIRKQDLADNVTDLCIRVSVVAVDVDEDGCGFDPCTCRSVNGFFSQNFTISRTLR